ncbi:hypothetical protein KBC79_04895 [Candidatus Woesebacteria bacterium]|nr:hypothetical protein [Candidatus Woesebacteria bacterium]
MPIPPEFTTSLTESEKLFPRSKSLPLAIPPELSFITKEAYGYLRRFRPDDIRGFLNGKIPRKIIEDDLRQDYSDRSNPWGQCSGLHDLQE